MHFIEAITYPYQSRKFWEILIVFALLSLIPIVNIIGGLILVGYGVRIIQAVMVGDTNLPEFDFGGDVGRGVTCIVIGIVYFIPTMLIAGFLLAFTREGDIASLSTLLFIAILAFVTYFVYFVGMVRYAVDENSAKFFEFGTNLNLLMNNFSQTIVFVVDLILFGIVVAILVSVGFALLVIPGLIVSYASQFSQYYLFAQWGIQMGIADEYKQKRKNTYEGEFV